MSDVRSTPCHVGSLPRRNDWGQTSIEWLGIAAVLVGILVVLLSAAPVLGDSLGQRVRCLIEAVSGGDSDADCDGGEADETTEAADDSEDPSAGEDPDQGGDGGGDEAGGGDDQNPDGDEGDPDGSGGEGDDGDAMTPLERATRGDYIAIGDSFSSGEGAGDYDGDSDCHRSANGYPNILADDYDFGGDVINVTCSGATIDNVNGPEGHHGEDPQIQAITPDASLITVGISGNDTGWTDVITSCATDGQMGGDLCGDTDAVRARMDAAVAEFDELLREIMAGDHDARVVALGYPRFFPDPPTEEWTYGCNPFGCLSRISVEDQAWMNDMFREYNDRLQEAAEANGVEFVDAHDAFDGCELTTASACMNGLMVDTSFSWPPASANPGSFHPNAQGQQQLADLLQQQIEDP